MYLDRMYDPASKSYRDLCRRVAEKRLEGVATKPGISGRYSVPTQLRTKFPNTSLQPTCAAITQTRSV